MELKQSGTQLIILLDVILYIYRYITLRLRKKILEGHITIERKVLSPAGVKVLTQGMISQDIDLNIKQQNNDSLEYTAVLNITNCL